MRRVIVSLFAAVMVLPLLSGSPAFSAPRHGPPRGSIQNDRGETCWFTQVVKEDNTYFHGSFPGPNDVITFKDPACMSASEVGLDVNIMTINNRIAGWYSHSDANFQTRVSELYNGSSMQKKGKCIQSRTYPGIGITIDYFIKNNSITGVIHGPAIQGCTN